MPPPSSVEGMDAYTASLEHFRDVSEDEVCEFVMKSVKKNQAWWTHFQCRFLFMCLIFLHVLDIPIFFFTVFVTQLHLESNKKF